MSLPAADDLFRPTTPTQGPNGVDDSTAADAAPANSQESPGDTKPSGRVRHDEKMTIYVTANELFAIEQARLVLRGTHGHAVDRGRLVREAVAIALADLDERGENSVLVQRLIGP